MKSTLEQYIDPANIPKVYGGQLDFEFGMMPVLEPAIDSALDWKKPSMQGTGRTIPTGPIKWEEGADGMVQAVAVGSDKGVPRRQVIATLKTSDAVKAMHGSSVTANTPLEEAELARLTTGESTHPVEEGEHLDTPPSGASTPPSETTLSIRQNASSTSSSRIGTSETRYVQQEGTHAAGQGAKGTPAVNEHGYGDKTYTVEPRTVGQAPKDISIPTAEEPKEESLVEEAKATAMHVFDATSNAVTSVTHTVLAKVGYEEAPKAEVTEEKEVPSPEKIEEDAKIDNLEKTIVEEYLRDRYHSGPTAPA